MAKIEKYTSWNLNEFEVRNYGGSGYNVYVDNQEVDYFTYYGTNPDRIVNEHLIQMCNEINY